MWGKVGPLESNLARKDQLCLNDNVLIKYSAAFKDDEYGGMVSSLILCLLAKS